MSTELPGLPSHAFDKYDTSPDRLFYDTPRFVTHIDDAAIKAVTGVYRALFLAGGVLLDLMGSWVSHLPDDVAYAQVIGHGMSAEELAANPRYTRWFVQDLNESPQLPLDSDSLDGVGLCVSIQYLQRPVQVLREVLRTLKPGAPIAISFSNRCFPTKAVAVWQGIEMGEHQHLVALYLQHAGFTGIEKRTPVPMGAGSDPLWTVIGRKPAHQ